MASPIAAEAVPGHWVRTTKLGYFLIERRAKALRLQDGWRLPTGHVRVTGECVRLGRSPSGMGFVKEVKAIGLVARDGIQR